jgi:hypothetical protein
MLRIASLLLVLFSLAACTLGYGDKLDAGLAESLNVQQVSVSIAPDATFWWGDGERAYARSVGRSEFDASELGRTPEGRAYMHDLASRSIKAAFDRELVGKTKGRRPVRVEIVMHNVTVPSAVQRVLIGGDYRMRAAANLVDARTGQVIASNPNLTISALAGTGWLGAAIDPAFGDPIDRLSENLATSYRNWLLPS